MAMKIRRTAVVKESREKLSILQIRNADKKPMNIKIREGLYALVGVMLFVILSAPAMSQSLSVTSDEPSGADISTVPLQQDTPYARPTQTTMVRNYVFDAYGPYPLVGAGIIAAINQSSNTPPEWHQGVEGYSKRFGSDFAIAAVGTTTRYGLSEAFKQDTLYYRCECQGAFPRLRHAVISTLTARSGENGHRVFSVPMLVAPYAGSMTAVYGWYPDRFGAKDAFRIGNYSLLLYMAGNISLEFIYSGPHSLFSRIHLNNAHGSTVEGPNK